jgi:hypothetical protein
MAEYNFWTYKIYTGISGRIWAFLFFIAMLVFPAIVLIIEIQENG